MIYMTENCDQEIKCVFENIQGITTDQAFYKRVYELILSCLRKNKKFWSKIGSFLKGITLEEIGLEGTIKFGDKKEVDFLEEINHLIPQLKDTKVILFLDELPEVLHNLYKNKKSDQASGIIKNLRKWRQKEQFGSLCFVLAGSVGIHHVVKTIEGRTSDLNDQYKIDFEDLGSTEANEYVTWATRNATVQYDEPLKTYLLQKIAHHIPYFINLMLDQIHKTAKKNRNPTITNVDVDDAFNKIVKNSDHFKDWRNRLVDYYEPNVAKFLDEILIYIAHYEEINKLKLYDTARKFKLSNDCIDLMDGLEKDGYIVERNDIYHFVSPFLQSYWKRYNLPK